MFIALAQERLCIVDAKMDVEAIASATGKMIDSVLDNGASFSIDLNSRVRVRLLDDGEIVGNINPLVREIAKKTLDFFGYDYGLDIKIESDIPVEAGLGDREAISTATILGVIGALAKKHGCVNELRIDKYVKEQFMMIDEKIVDKKKLIDLSKGFDMEFDRSCSSFYGGFVVSNNKKGEILRRGEMEDLYVIVLIPKEKKEIDLDEVKLFKNEIEIAWNEALKGNLYSAMNLNTLVYENKIARKMLKAGALSVSISFPSIIALVRDKNKIGDIENSVELEGDILTKKVNNEKAKILGKPKKIVKIKEFLELKGEQEFHWI